MRIGIFFGGRSREREISFAGGRTVFDNLDKGLFTPVPIFVDSFGNFILLDWKYLYKGTIRDFYPSIATIENTEFPFQTYIESIEEDDIVEANIARIGEKVRPDQFSNLIDFAFLALHGPFGEDGNIQGMLDWYDIPYSGAGILPSSIGINKSAQRSIIRHAGFDSPHSETYSRLEWQSKPDQMTSRILEKFSFPFVIKAPHQGSSIGVNIVNDTSSLKNAIDRSFFIQKIDLTLWKEKSNKEKYGFLTRFTDIREGLGFPVVVDSVKEIHHPKQLWEYLDGSNASECILEATNGEAFILIESFIKGKEFSCIVIEDELGKPVALPPTEIKKSNDLFDYRSKYLPGISRKITPIDLSLEDIQNIRTKCQDLYTVLHSEVYARIDGFFTEEGKIFLNDPNTTSGMLPSSFFFHQAAEIGLNPSQFLSLIIERSLKARYKSGKNLFSNHLALTKLRKQLSGLHLKDSNKTKVGIIMGGFSSERHISIESGRNIFEKLASSSKYDPIPIFLTGNEAKHELYLLPINIMLKDNADDIKQKVHDGNAAHPIIDLINDELKVTKALFIGGTELKLQPLEYTSLKVHIDFAFIALHGRPGEDGAVQIALNKNQIPFNGSDVASSQLTINKFETNEKLRKHGILVANHRLVYEDAYRSDKEGLIHEIEGVFQYPIIAKPADDGCSSAVKKIKNREELMAFCEMTFRKSPEFLADPASTLGLKYNEEFPQKQFFLIEDLIVANDADQFLEITGGVITNFDENGQLTFTAFDPSEALASGEILSLEEKFLAGEGQNITPARFGKSKQEFEFISNEVKKTLIETAKICEIEGYCRIDAFVRIWEEKVETIIIEINSLPGMTPATAIFHQAALQNLKPYEFIDSIISFGFARLKSNQPV
ncbi:MAG: D-alanine--D-alanine ligase [Cyclobacteriaceae bacterium]